MTDRTPEKPGRRFGIEALLVLGAFFIIVIQAAGSAMSVAAEGKAGTSVAVQGNVSVREAAALLADPPAGLIILDVRTPQEFREGHLAGARNMDFFGGAFEMQTADLPKDAPVLIYCRSGKRSAAAAESLGEAGVTRILHMHEGIAGWKGAGLPLEK